VTSVKLIKKDNCCCDVTATPPLEMFLPNWALLICTNA